MHLFQDFHGQMAEPSCDRLFDFDFEKRATGDHEMSEAEVSRDTPNGTATNLTATADILCVCLC